MPETTIKQFLEAARRHFFEFVAGQPMQLATIPVRQHLHHPVQRKH